MYLLTLTKFTHVKKQLWKTFFFLMKNDVVCFRDSAEFLINYKWQQSKEKNVTEEAVGIVKKAAKIILGQMRS